MIITASNPFGTDRIRLIAIEMKGAFGNEGALRFFLLARLLSLVGRISSLIMPVTLDRPKIADRLQRARRLQAEIAKLEKELATLFAGVPKHLLIRNHCGLTAGQMSKIAQNLHARAKEKIATGRSKEFRGSIEDLV
jgi:hypothetical protein